jgi:1,4-dihydroxy-2-naphthoate octaprenyltransferase
MKTNFTAGFWRLADPKISLASMASIFLGTCAAAADGPIHWAWLAATIAGIFAIEVGKNASGEVFDFDSGTDLAVAEGDRSPFSGGKRVMVDGLLTRGQTWLIAAVSYALGAAVGLLIALWREPSVLWLGLVGGACAFLYHAPPVRLSYRGLGELAVALCYGPLICAGTYLVQRGQVTAPVLCLSLPLGLLVGAFLWINEFPDYLADRASGKNNLVVRLGRPLASRVFSGILAWAFLLLLFLPAVGVPSRVWLAAAAAPPAFSAARRLMAHPESTPQIIPAQARTLLAFVLYAIGGGIGLLLG